MSRRSVGLARIEIMRALELTWGVGQFEEGAQEEGPEFFEQAVKAV